MRLLHFDALDRLMLTDFRGKPIPPYAILSHRWTDSEILIEDISNGSYKEKDEGNTKLHFCAKQAAQDRLHYFWIDTCCIDLWDNNERSKAINSMFQWYRDAARCYVFLSDVSLPAVTETEMRMEMAHRSDWETSFSASAWFTRGWTLQELIAPTSVEFFSREGQRIGDKASLGQLLHNITGIPRAALDNCPLDQFSTLERMQWAGKRTTKEEEDIVYCLLGLLGISMPVTYGEGQENARKRLQAEIEAASSAPSIIPFLRNESFAGRELQLADLQAKLFSDDQTTTTLAIVGLGGTGKSQLALEVAHRTRLDNNDCSVFWMDASDKASLYQSYASVAQKLSIPGHDDDQADIKQVVKLCVAELSTRQCLLIFDNAEGTTIRPIGSRLSSEGDESLVEFLPRSKLCSVIFTTTESATAEALAPPNVTRLHELTPDTALTILQSRLTTPISNDGQSAAMHLLRELSYLPLAIAQAAACMNVSGMTVQQYSTQLAKHRQNLLKHSNDPSSQLQESGLRNTVAATLSFSLGQVCEKSTVAAEFLLLAACVDRKDILLDLLEADSPQAREDAIKVLDRYALVTRRPADSALDVHRLVHDELRKRLHVRGRLQEWIQRTITQLLRVFPNHDHGNRSKWRRLLPHALSILSHSERNDNNDDKLDLRRKVGLQVQGRLQKWTHHTTTQLLRLFPSHDQRNRSKWRQLLPHALSVLSHSQQSDNNEDRSELTRICAMALYMDGQYKGAEELQFQELQRARRVLGDEHPSTLSSMNNLASIYKSHGRWKDAEELQIQVMQRMTRVLGKEHPSTLTSISNLAVTYESQGRWKDAEELQLQELQTTRRVLGNEHPSTLISMSNLALTYESQGRWKDAQELQVQELQLTKQVYGEEHPNTLISMNNLASTYSNQGRSKEAEELQMQVMQITKRVLGDEHPDTLTSRNNLALTYRDQRRWKEAEELQVEEFQTTKRVLGSEHPDTLTSMHNLALTYRDLGWLQEAVSNMEICLQLRQQILGEEHHDTQSSLNTLHGWRAEGSDEKQ